jgi:hypothetical protein
MERSRLQIDRLDWDDWNIPHIARHNVTPRDVEEVVTGDASFRETYKGRFQLVGPTLSGHMLAVILGPVPHQPGVYYVFTARPASRKERLAYAQIKGDITQ